MGFILRLSSDGFRKRRFKDGSTELCLILRHVKPGDRSYKPRLVFKDAMGERFECAVTDLALWTLCHSLISQQGLTQEKALQTMLDSIVDADRLYIRLGLARPWQTSSGEQRCYLLVSAVHTFPDYLKGKTFAEF